MHRWLPPLCSHSRLELYRFERRFCNKTYAQVVQLVRSHNALGLDQFLRHVAPKTDLGYPQPDLRKRNALARRTLGPSTLLSAPARVGPKPGIVRGLRSSTRRTSPSTCTPPSTCWTLLGTSPTAAAR